MLVTPTFALPPVHGLPSDWDGIEAELNEALLAPLTTSALPVFPDTLPPSDDASATALVVAPTEPTAEEPDWMLVEPWVLAAVHEYDARYA